MKKRLMGSSAIYRVLQLKHPGDDGNNDVNDSGDNDAGNGGGNGGGGNKKQTPPKADDDLSLDDIYGGDDSGDDDNEPFQLPEDEDDDDPEETARQTAAAKEVKGQIENLLNNYAINESDIPDDLGFADKKAAAALFTQVGKSAMQQTMKIMNPVISHALGIAVNGLTKKIDTSVKSTTGQNDAKKAFSDLGFAGADAKLAKQFFNSALAGKKMSVTQAAKATRNAMAQLGKSGKAVSSNQNDGGRSGNGGQMKTGQSALDSIFGS
jgi:hypothetical protein